MIAQHTVRAGAGAAIGVVTKLMDVEASLSIGVMAGKIPADGGRGVFIGLLESHLAGDLGISSEDGNYSILILATARRGRMAVDSASVRGTC